MKIGILHGWLLEGSGSNIYVRSLAGALAARGHEVHVICQEPHPERVISLAGADRYYVHVPHIDHALMPVYNADTSYEGFSEVRAFHELTEDPRLERYLSDFAAGAEHVCRSFGVQALHANHCYPMPEVARRVKQALGLPYLVFPHGSAIEYTLKKSPELALVARKAIDEADALIVGNKIVSERIFRLYPERAGDWKKKHGIVSVGVDPVLFDPVDPSARAAAAESLIAEGIEGGGKTRAMTRALLLDTRPAGDSALLEAVSRARKAYDHKAPDADLAAKLRAVDWKKDKIIVYAGKIIIGKGIHDFIAALPEILERHPALTLFVAGEGPYREGLELLLHALSEGDRELLERIVRLGWDLDHGPSRGLDKVAAYLGHFGIEKLLALGRKTRPLDHVVFTGYLKHPLFRHLLPCGDLAVFPSEVAEAYPLVLLESISAGVLPAASYFEGLGEGLDTIGERLGHIAPLMRFEMDAPKRVASMVANVRELLSREPSWRTGCRKLAVEVYSWGAVAAEMEKVYARLAR